MQPTARSLILDLLSTLKRGTGTMPVRALIEAGALVGLEENNIRVSLARLYASNRIERDERGRYRLGPAVAAMSGQLQNWRKLDARMRPWEGHWIALHQPRVGRGPTRRRRERALARLGFRELESGFSFRPDNLVGGVDGLRKELVGLVAGDDTTATDATIGRIFVVRDLDPISDLEVRSLWDADALAEEARSGLRALRESEARMHGLTPAEAMAESFLVGGRILRQLVSHPLLPAEILKPEPLSDLLDAMKRYDRLGRKAWAAFLARHDVDHRPGQGLPLDSGRTGRDLVPADEAAYASLSSSSASSSASSRSSARRAANAHSSARPRSENVSRTRNPWKLT